MNNLQNYNQSTHPSIPREEESVFVPSGMYHIVHDSGGWRCAFVEEGCMALLRCTREDFLNALRSGVVFLEPDGSETPMFTVLDGLMRIPGARHTHSGFVRHGDGRILRVKSILNAQRDGTGAVHFYGHVLDLTAQYEHDRAQTLQREGLLRVSRSIFPEILTMNLTQGTYHVLQYDDTASLGSPRTGGLLDVMERRLPYIFPEDREAYRDTIYPDSMLRKVVDEGEEMFSLIYRRAGRDMVHHWTKTVVMRQPNPFDDDVIVTTVTRTIDEEKREEELLRQALEDTSQRMDEWLYYNYLSKETYPGLVFISYEDGRASPYNIGQLARRLNFPPNELALGTLSHIHPAHRDAVRLARESAEAAGDKEFWAEYQLDLDDGSHVYISNQAFQFTDRAGVTGYIHFLTDTTYEHNLSEQVRQYMEAKLEENERLFDLVAQHSDRTLCYYDVRTQRARPWNEESCLTCHFPHLCLHRMGREEFERSEYILSDSADEVRRMFRDIHNGVHTGAANLHVKMPDGGQRWLEFKYTTLFEGAEVIAAVLSFSDVTDQHDHAVSYLRYRQSLEAEQHQQLSYMEADLTADLIEAHTGLELWNTASAVGTAYSAFAGSYSMGLDEPDSQTANALYSRDNLLAQYEKGNRTLEHLWQLHRSEGALWVLNRLEMMSDPFTDHVKLFFTMSDVTAEQEEKLAVLQRADYDAMTGLLRRGSGEEQIRRALSPDGETGGILIALDLDDLKGINDTLGHNHGDRAIRGIADTLKGHFRKGDLMIRAGGDEFMVFLPGAGRSVSSVELSLTSLLRKLGALSVGDNDERRIHCSAGCAVERPGLDTFESLYQRADLALYHVKRSGKNNFAFFDPEMLQEDYQFKMKQAQLKQDALLSHEEGQHLLDALARSMPGIFSFNLTQDRFRVLRTNIPGERLPQSDDIASFWATMRDDVHPDDREGAMRVLFRDQLLQAYEQGQRTLLQNLRCRSRNGFISIEVRVYYHTTDAGDVCAFLFFRPDVAPEQARKVLQLEKILELSGTAEFEYICLIDVREGTYHTFSRGCENTHEIPEIADFNMATRHIRDTQIAPEERDAYFDNAALDRVLAHMAGPEGRYSYRYNLKDGVREASFTWYESSRSELLMTVRKLPQATD